MSGDSKLLLNSSKYSINDVIRYLNDCPLIKTFGSLEGTSSVDFYTIELSFKNGSSHTLYLCSSAESPLGKCLSIRMDFSNDSIDFLSHLGTRFGGLLMKNDNANQVYESWNDPGLELDFLLKQVQTKGYHSSKESIEEFFENFQQEQ